MGEEILRFFQIKLKKEFKIAFTSTFIIAILVHLYKFTNTLPNHDSVFNYYSNQNILGSGRWALSLACGISSFYDLPWVIGLLSCIYIALTVVVIVALFKLQNPVLIGLVGGLIAAAPATTETFFFLYTADGYMLAMFLAALAAYFSRIDGKGAARWILSGICICISCGIYQAYVSFALLLTVCYFIDELLQNNHSKKKYFNWLLYQGIVYIVSLASYFVIWKLCMRFNGTVANDYLGISEVGKMSFGLLINGFISSVKTIIKFFLQIDRRLYSFTLYGILNIIFVILMGIGLFIAIHRSRIFKRKWAFVLFVFCLSAIIPFACIWHFTSEAVVYRAMMLQSLTILFVLTALLYERWTKSVTKNSIGLFLLVVVMHNALMANISYFYMNLCYERTYAEGVEMMVEIHNLQDEYEFDKIAVVGVREYGVKHENMDLKTGEIRNVGKIRILTHILEKTLLFDAEHTTSFLEATFGMNLEPLNREERKELLNTDEVRAMGCWPEGDSITVIGDTLVLKFSDGEEEQ